MKKILKITSIILIQAFLVLDFTWAAGGELSAQQSTIESNTLAPDLKLDVNTIKGVFTNSFTLRDEIIAFADTQIDNMLENRGITNARELSHKDKLFLIDNIYKKASNAGFFQSSPGNVHGIYTGADVNSIDALCEKASIGKNNNVCDLGSGDGRVGVIAGGLYGAKVILIEKSKDFVENSRFLIESVFSKFLDVSTITVKQDDLFRFLREDEADVRSIDTFYYYNQGLDMKNKGRMQGDLYATLLDVMPNESQLFVYFLSEMIFIEPNQPLFPLPNTPGRDYSTYRYNQGLGRLNGEFSEDKKYYGTGVKRYAPVNRRKSIPALKKSEIEEVPKLAESTNSPFEKLLNTKLTRRDFGVISAIGIAKFLLGPAISDAANGTTGVEKYILGDLVEESIFGEFNDLAANIDTKDINKYMSVLKDYGLEKYTEKITKADKTLLNIKGLFRLNAEMLAKEFNKTFGSKKLPGRFTVKDSTATWKESVPCKVIEDTANEIAWQSESRGLGEIDEEELKELFEDITFVESKFRHWKEKIFGTIKLNLSPTGAIGVTQLVISEAVEEIIRLILRDKGGLTRFDDIIEELQRIASKQAASEEKERIAEYNQQVEDYEKQRKKGKKPGPEPKQLVVYDELIALIKARGDQEKTRTLINSIERKIYANDRLLGVNFYYALALWSYFSQRDQKEGKPVDIILDDKIAAELAATENVKVKTGEHSFKPENFEKARTQFNQEYFHTKLIKSLIGEDIIKGIIKKFDNEKSRTEAFKKYFETQVKKSKTYNQIFGYTYAAIQWDWARRQRLQARKDGKGYELKEEAPEYFVGKEAQFSTELLSAAAYNAGKGPVINSLNNLGTRLDINNIPLWLKNLYGTNSDNRREPVNYIRMYLEYKLQYKGELDDAEYAIMNNLIEERYKRTQRVLTKKGYRLQELSGYDKKSRMYREVSVTRKDKFDYKLAALLASILGSDYVDSFLISWGLGEKWETNIFNSNNPTFEDLAERISDSKSKHYEMGNKLIKHLGNRGGFKLTLDALTGAVEQYKEVSIKKVQLRKGAERRRIFAQNEKISGHIELISKISGVAIIIAGIVAWIRSRIKTQAKPNTSLQNIRYPQKVPFFKKLVNTILRRGRRGQRFFSFMLTTGLMMFTASNARADILDEVLLKVGNAFIGTKGKILGSAIDSIDSLADPTIIVIIAGVLIFVAVIELFRRILRKSVTETAVESGPKAVSAQLIEQDGFVPKNEVEERTGQMLDEIIEKNNKEIPLNDKANRMVASKYRVTNAKEKDFQNGAGGRLLAQVVIRFEDGSRRDYILKEYRYGNMDEHAYHILRVLGIPASETRLYGNVFLIRPIGQFDLGEVKETQYQNPDFSSKLAYLAGQAGMRAFALGMVDRKAKNMRVILDNYDMPKQVINADLSEAFHIMGKANTKAAVSSVIWILSDMLTDADQANVSDEDLAEIIDSFIRGFEDQIMDFQRNYPKIVSDFGAITLDEDTVISSKAKGMLKRLDPEQTNYENLRRVLLSTILNRIGSSTAINRRTDFLDQFFEKEGVFFPRVSDLLESLRKNEINATESNKYIFEELFDAFDSMANNLTRKGKYQTAILCDTLCLDLSQILMNIDSENANMWQTRNARISKRIQQSTSTTDMLTINVDRLDLKGLFEKAYNQKIVNQAI